MAEAVQSNSAPKKFADLLPSLAINGVADVLDASDDGTTYVVHGEGYFNLGSPIAAFFCENCNGERRFDGEVEYGSRAYLKKTLLSCLRYRCRDCGRYERLIVLRIAAGSKAGHARVFKVAEWPRHGEPIDAKILKALGEDWAPLFEKGVQAENMGLGAGAFTYYRAVVEDGFKTLLSKIEKVLTNEGANKEHVTGIQRAANEKQFSKAVDIAKPHLPSSLMVSGHNPLKLLHDLLSYDLHAADDMGALEKATDIRQLLTHLTRSIQQTLDANEAAQKSLANLLKAQKENRTRP